MFLTNNKTYSKIYSYSGVRDPTSIEIEPMVTLTFDRQINESNGILQLVSQLSINNVAAHLNGTIINCTESALNLENIKSQIIIHIVNTDNGMCTVHI